MSGSACFSWSAYVSWPYRYHLYFLACVLLGCLSFLIEYGGGLVVKLCLTFVIPWTVACQARLSIVFPRQEYRSELPFPSPGDLPDPGIEPMSPALQADSLPLSHRGSPTTLSLHTSNTHSKPGHTLHCFWHIHMFSESVPAVTSLHSPVNTLSILQVAFSRSLPGSPQTKGAPSLSES